MALLLSACDSSDLVLKDSPEAVELAESWLIVEQGTTSGVQESDADVDVEALTALINKQNPLPEGYTPDDLVYPEVRFIFDDKIEKRMMRKEAAQALETLFAAASEGGLPLAGVSAYRSHARQKQLFEGYVKRHGLEKAQTYSAYPGTSEHETGLAIDVTGADGSCAATDCFADRPEAEWLDKNAYRFGFIIRYPKGKEHITGYKYEPWHLRYVGEALASELHQQQLTMEEYEGVFPVNS
ncbi:putative peptidase M15 [Paenibacillus sp. 598K]|uniref:M15 family metallopeptidase n=1 Tax=Paenibacillus sp. 598K TaxID=1117987 RepID=UPI000FFAB5C7|nr:M15 family metallopeptidase [Paenibacillus sp. 598K]GBF76481.1 putative peptidase M15 [Paenibacillus sp. 598K]